MVANCASTPIDPSSMAWRVRVIIYKATQSEKGKAVRLVGNFPYAHFSPSVKYIVINN